MTGEAIVLALRSNIHFELHEVVLNSQDDGQPHQRIEL